MWKRADWLLLIDVVAVCRGMGKVENLASTHGWTTLHGYEYSCGPRS